MAIVVILESDFGGISGTRRRVGDSGQLRRVDTFIEVFGNIDTGSTIQVYVGRCHTRQVVDGIECENLPIDDLAIRIHWRLVALGCVKHQPPA
ncbi:hypothetical protein D3C84_391450 [compost metagenome]